MYTGEKLEFSNKFDKEYILAHKEIDPIDGKFTTTQFIDRIGYNVDSVSLEDRGIYIRGAILAENPEIMLELRRKAKNFFSPQYEIKMIYGKYSMIFRPNKTLQEDKDWRKTTNRFYLFHIYGTAHYPLWKLAKNSVVENSKSKGGFHFPLIIPKNKGITFGYKPAIVPNHMPNLGDVPVGFVWKVIAKYGDVTNPKIVDNRTNEQIEVNIALAIGDIIEISTESGNKYAKLIRGDVETDIFDLITTKSRMSLQLQVGMNNFSVTAAGNSANMEIYIKYSPGYLEVD